MFDLVDTKRVGMPDTNGLMGDLEYLQSKYSLESTLISSFTSSPETAHVYLQLLRTKTISTCLLPATLGFILLLVGIYWRYMWFGTVLGILGTLGACYFGTVYVKQQKMLSELIRIAKYHNLI